jgi:hypothetical protein
MHHHQPDQRELVPQAYFTEDFNKEFACACGTEKRETPVATAGDVDLSGARVGSSTAFLSAREFKDKP